MRNKKLFSTVVATALATTMAMPVMAADGGTVDVDVSTKSAVIRVEVPTSMEIAVDQFESVDAGAQIYSTPFTMKNKSGVGVKIGVASTATATAGLVASVQAVEESTAAGGEAWLAVAAQTEAGKYGAEVGELTEASANVATFDGTTKKAEQTFYLGKGTGAVEYKMLYPADAGKAGETSYSQFYALTAVTTNTGTEQDDLNAAIAAKDVYVSTEAAADGIALSRVEKGGSHTYDAAEFYYTAADTVTAAGSVAASTPYVYAGTATVGGEAAFRYIGKLSEAKTTAWTKSDISKINIAYTIDGVTASAFDEANTNCTYGLYTAPVGPSITTKTYTMEADKAVKVAVDTGAGSLAAKSMSIMWGSVDLKSKGYATYANGEITITPTCINLLMGKTEASQTVVVTFTDAAGKTTSENITLNKPATP
ncbi:MAG: hypothetical protein HFH12_10140 [Dorea sp.]|nr:hypothetical protein [Dorea sp.]